MRLPWLDPFDEDQPFPDPEQALTQPNGLLAVGGNFSPRRLLRAYRQGIFPWCRDGEPILWWSPNPRLVLFPEAIKVSRSLRKVLRNGPFTVTADTAFAAVMSACAVSRKPFDEGTWITKDVQHAYSLLHQLGYAHSLETWMGGRLVGGLYGVGVGRVFFGESMFSQVRDASKVALVALAIQLRRWNFAVIDCQVRTEHLMRLGAVEIERSAFLHLLECHCASPGREGPWCLEGDWLADVTKLTTIQPKPLPS